jgi:hypothetical protein
MDELVDEIGSLLARESGFRNVLLPLRLADIEFRFDAVLVGPSGSDDLLVIIDLQAKSKPATRRRIQGLVTVLDRLNSHRSVTAVIIIRDGSLVDMSELEKYCHIVVVRPNIPLQTALRILLPLKLDTHDEQEATDSIAALRREVGSNDSYINNLIDQSPNGADAVARTIAAQIDSIITQVRGKLDGN